jgi:hypothetical protein
MDPARAQYDEAGVLVCPKCKAHGMVTHTASALAERDTQVKGGLLPGAAGALLISVVSLCVEVRIGFFVLPLLAVVGGLGTALTAVRRPGARESLGWRYAPIVVMGGLAALLGCLSLGIHLAVRMG